MKHLALASLATCIRVLGRGRGEPVYYGNDADERLELLKAGDTVLQRVLRSAHRG